MGEMCFELYGCRYVQIRTNCRYPIRMVIRSPADLCRAAGHDFVCARYKDNYRMNDNFESADVAFWDVDNSGTDDPGKWITPEKIGEQIHSRDSSGHLPMSLASSIEFTVSDKADANGQPGPESHG